MQYFTLYDIITAVDQELDLEGQDGVADSLCSRQEKIEFVNRAIDVIEADVHKLGLEDEYFLASQPLQLAEGQKRYGLPTDIYATKIKQIVYHNGTIIYPIKRLRRLNQRTTFEQAAYIDQYGSADYYMYMLQNDGTSFQNEIVLYPTSRETAPSDPGSQQICTIYYIRKANVLTQDNDMLDIPEGSNYVKQFVKCRILAKQFRGVVPPQEVDLLNEMRTDLIATLREQVPDQENQITQDTSFYLEYDSYGWAGGGGTGY